MSTAGFPATTEKAGTSLVTTAPAATTPPSPTVTPRKIMAPAPIQASSQILTGLSSSEISRGWPRVKICLICSCRAAARSGWVRLSKNIGRVRDQDTISDDDGSGRPNPASLAEVAPFADLDLSAMRERQELAQDPAVGTDDDPVGVASNVPDPGTGAEHGIVPQPAGRAPDEPLDQVIDIHAVNRKHATAREDAARSSPHPLPVWTSKTVALASASADCRDQPSRE